MTEREKDKVPLFSSWKTWYALVIGFLVLMILFFNYLTKYFS